MQTREARLLQATGAIKSPLIRQTDGGWSVELPGKHGLNPLLELARGGPRVFKTLDAAIEVLFEIGFSTVTVQRHPPL